MGRKDIIAKKYLNDNRNFADIFNVLLFGGEQVIKESDLEERSIEEWILEELKEKDKVVLDKYRDILKEAIVKDAKNCYCILLGIENQSEIHYAMPVRNYLMDAINYHEQVRAISKQHKQEKDLEDAAQYLSGFTSDDKIKPVITLTIYWGNKKWDGPVSLHDMFVLGDDRLLSFVPDYRMHLITPQDDIDFDLFQSDFGLILKAIRYSSNEEMMGNLFNHDSRYNDLKRDTAEVINEFTNLNLSFSKKEEQVDMCKAWDDHYNSGYNSGYNNGSQMGMQALVVTLKDMLPDFDTVYNKVVSNEAYKDASREEVMKYYH